MSDNLIPISFPIREPLPDGAVLLCADVGGTKTDLALFELRNGKLSILKETVYPSKGFDSLSEIVRQFKDEMIRPERFCIAFAGPVNAGKVEATNLKWSINAETLSRELNIPQVFVINDLEAEAYGLADLEEKDLVTIYKGAHARQGNAAIIAPGTGLGEAGLFWDGATLRPFATEGGHADFAPRSEFDCELFHYLQQQFGHVSWERVISGPGIHQIYCFLRDIKKWEEPAGLLDRIEEKDPSAVISIAAADGVPICEETLRLFVRYLAIEASNLGLKLNAIGGIFLAGGILPKIWNEDLKKVFLQHFFEVGRLKPLIKAVPVYLIMNPKTALLGAAHFGK